MTLGFNVDLIYVDVNGFKTVETVIDFPYDITKKKSRLVCIAEYDNTTIDLVQQLSRVEIRVCVPFA